MAPVEFSPHAQDAPRLYILWIQALQEQPLTAITDVNEQLHHEFDSDPLAHLLHPGHVQHVAAAMAPPHGMGNARGERSRECKERS